MVKPVTEKQMETLKQHLLTDEYKCFKVNKDNILTCIECDHDLTYRDVNILNRHLKTKQHGYHRRFHVLENIYNKLNDTHFKQKVFSLFADVLKNQEIII